MLSNTGYNIFWFKNAAKGKFAAKTQKNVESNNYFVNAKFVTSIAISESTDETDEFKFSRKKNEFWGTLDGTRIGTQRNPTFFKFLDIK